MEINGLEIITLNTSTKPIAYNLNDDILMLLDEHFQEKAFVVGYLDYKVEIGYWENNRIHFSDKNESLNPRFIQKLRIFNASKELLLWRTSAGIKGRIREDNLEGNQMEAIVAQQVLFGTRRNVIENNLFSEVIEERGTRITLPFSEFEVDAKKQRICIKTYNYIGYLKDTFQATFVDCRFVSFTNRKNDLK